MPIYEYKCKSCNNDFEVMQKMSDEPLRECPHCHQHTLEKQWSLSGIQFKGTGWYISDYTNKGKEPKTDAGSSPKTSAATESTASPTTASKSETTTAKTE